MNCYGYNYYKNCYPNPLPEEQVVSGLQGPQGPRGEQGPQGEQGIKGDTGEWQARRAPGDPKGSGATWDRREILAP